MAKVMLVEDDNNLREIYQARLVAEGYEIVSAQDGEEALALAVKEKPDLIIADIMMPKISGFDMLDILRSTPETKDTKVVMMTALSQAEDKDRANKLGADRYLVKSQVTLEDVARVAREVLEGKEESDTIPTPPTTPTDTANLGSAASAPAPSATDSGQQIPVTVAPQPIQIAQAPPAPDPAASNSAVLDNAMQNVGNPTAGAAIPDDVPSGGIPVPDNSQTAVHTKVINPINDLSHTGVDLNALVAKEEAKENAINAAQGFTPSNVVVGDVNNPSGQSPDSQNQVPPSTPSAGDPNSIAL